MGDEVKRKYSPTIQVIYVHYIDCNILKLEAIT